LAHVERAGDAVIFAVHVDPDADPIEALVVIGAQIAVIARGPIGTVGRGDVGLRFGDIGLVLSGVGLWEWVHEARVVPGAARGLAGLTGPQAQEEEEAQG
jgi:hypothetical protein